MADNNPGTISTCVYQTLPEATRAPLIRQAAERAVKNGNISVSERSGTSLFGRRKRVWQIGLSGVYYNFINRHEGYRFLADVFQYLAANPQLLSGKKS